MRKLIILITAFVLLLATALILYFTFKSDNIDEKVFCVKTDYMYLSDGEVELDIKLYTNDEDSLIKYANEANVYIHDKMEENLVMVDILDVYNSTNTVYVGEKFYEYTLIISFNITELTIKDCYLTMEFSEKGYKFNLGSVEIKENKYEKNPYKITNLYGLSSNNDLSLKAIVLTIKNDTDEQIKINKASLGLEYDVVVNKSNEVLVSDETKIEDYEYTLENRYILVESNTTKTFIMPILNGQNQLTNCYILFEINGEFYYINNFNFINSNDLESSSKYIFEGIIYEV